MQTAALPGSDGDNSSIRGGGSRSVAHHTGILPRSRHCSCLRVRCIIVEITATYHTVYTHHVRLLLYCVPRVPQCLRQ